MGLLGWFRRRTPDLARDGSLDRLIQETTDYVIRMTDPRLAVVSRARDKLAPAVETSIRFLQEQRALLPEPHLLSAQQWGLDPCLKCMFVTAQDVDKTLAEAAELRNFFEHAPLLEEAHAIMGMSVREQQVLGMALKGEMVQRDVALTTVSFSDHRLRLFGDSPQSLWRAIARRLIDELALIALSRINAEREERKSLETDTALLRARLRTFERRGTGLDHMLQEGQATGNTDSRKLLHQLETNERKLKALGASDSQLERELELLRAVFAAPAERIEVQPRQLHVDDLNQVLDENQGGTLIEYDLVRVRRDAETIERAFIPVRVGRQLPQASGLRLDEASALLG